MFLKRLLVGIVIGAVLGALVAAVLVQGLGIAFTGGTGAAAAYLSAAVTGVLTGLITGKPIWAAEGRIEAGLKAFFGMLLSLGAMFALRRWVTVPVDLTALKAGAGALGELPAVSLPIVAGLLGGFFELDNTPEAEGDKAKDGASGPKVRVTAGKSKDEELHEEEEEEPAQKKGRK